MHLELTGRVGKRILIDTQIQASRDGNDDGSVGSYKKGRCRAIIADLSDQRAAAGAGNRQSAQSVFPAALGTLRADSRFVAEIDRAGGGDVQLVARSYIYLGVDPLRFAGDGDVGTGCRLGGRGCRQGQHWVGKTQYEGQQQAGKH